MNRHIIILLLPFTLLACRQSKEELIAKRWKAVSVESPKLDEEIRRQRTFVDTIGANNTPEVNEAQYGVRNMDSMRQVMKQQLELVIARQKESMVNTWLDFHKDGTVIVNFGDRPDTVSWYFEDDGALMLDEMKQKGTGSKIRMEVITLEKEKLQLRFDENGFSSTASFVPAPKS